MYLWLGGAVAANWLATRPQVLYRPLDGPKLPAQQSNQWLQENLVEHQPPWGKRLWGVAADLAIVGNNLSLGEKHCELMSPMTIGVQSMSVCYVVPSRQKFLNIIFTSGNINVWRSPADVSLPLPRALYGLDEPKPEICIVTRQVA